MSNEDIYCRCGEPSKKRNDCCRNCGGEIDEKSYETETEKL